MMGKEGGVKFSSKPIMFHQHKKGEERKERGQAGTVETLMEDHQSH